MPSITRKICNKHGIYTGTRCPKCKATYDKSYNKTARNIKSTSFYNTTAWRKLRIQILKRDGGICARCGNISNKMIVDHVVPIEVDWNLRLREDNLQLLCVSCHNTKTREDKEK